MIAKLVVWGKDRASALTKLHAALSEFNIHGLSTNINFLMDLASHPEFVKGNVDTEFIPRHHDELFKVKKEVTDRQIVQAALATVLSESANPIVSPNDPFSPFTAAANSGSRFNHSLIRTLKMTFRDTEVQPRVIFNRGNTFKIVVGDREYQASGQIEFENGLGYLTAEVDGETSKTRVLVTPEEVRLFTRDSGSVDFKRDLPKFLSEGVGGGLGAGGAVAPMPGVIEKVNVAAGDEVKAGDPLVVMIAMKMEYVIKAPKAGKVAKVSHKQGDFVAKNTPLVQFEEED